MNDLIHLEGVSRTYQLGKTPVTALRDIEIGFVEGELAALAGPSGSGKTTMLNMVGLIDQPSSGRVFLAGREIRYNGLARLHRIRLSQIGFVFQTFNLIPVLNAFENVEYPLLLTNMTRQERKKRVDGLLDANRLQQQRKHKPAELSGGQRQRVAIARALVNRPKIILADEPTANIDSATASEILDLMAALNKKEGTTFVFSSHDKQVINMASRVITLKDGRIVH